MCESSSVSPSFSSDSSCRRRLVYRDVVLVRRLLRYDDILLDRGCECKVACVTGGQSTFIREFVCTCTGGIVPRDKWLWNRRGFQLLGARNTDQLLGSEMSCTSSHQCPAVIIHVSFTNWLLDTFTI